MLARTLRMVPARSQPGDALVAPDQLTNVPKGGGVYVVRAATGQFKIGVAQDLRHRFRELQAASPVRLEFVTSMPGTREDEGEVHRVLARHRLHGEWFAPDDDVLEVVKHFTPDEIRRRFDAIFRAPARLARLQKRFGGR